MTAGPTNVPLLPLFPPLPSLIQTNEPSKMLPPLTPPPPVYTRTMRSSSDSTNKQPELQDLQRSHLQFAHAFHENDTAKILFFLDKDVVLHTCDRQVLSGQAAVLAYLVSTKMEKLSRQIAMSKSQRPSITNKRTTAWTYERQGLLGKQPLYTEAVEWKSATLVTCITHTINSSVSKERRRSLSRSSLTSTTSSSSLSTLSSNGSKRWCIQEIQVTTRSQSNSPIRKRSRLWSSAMYVSIWLKANAPCEWKSAPQRLSVMASAVVWKHVNYTIDHGHPVMELSVWEVNLFKHVKLTSLDVQLAQEQPTPGKSYRMELPCPNGFNVAIVFKYEEEIGNEGDSALESDCTGPKATGVAVKSFAQRLGLLAPTALATFLLLLIWLVVVIPQNNTLLRLPTMGSQHRE